VWSVAAEFPSVPSVAAATGVASSTGPDATIRYRCAACGNLTRFNVVTNRRTRAFHHFSVGGDLSVEDEEVLDESVEEVSCRWCGNGNAIEVIEGGSPEAG
jgi:hypothetical protein